MSRDRTALHRWLPLLFAALIPALLPTAAAARESTCPELIPRQRDAVEADKAGNPSGRLIPLDRDGTGLGQATIAIDFGAGRDRQIRTQTYRPSPGVDPETIRVTPLSDILSEDHSLPTSEEQLTMRVGVDPITHWAKVRVCYDPGAKREPAPGRYVGTLTVISPEAKPVALGVEFTFRDRSWVGAAFALLLGILAGIAVQAIASYQQAPKETRPRTVRPYVVNFRTLLSIGAGVVTAIATYGRVVEADPTWNSTGPTLLALAGATFSATLAAKTAVDLKGPTEKERDKGLA